ncbi:MAG: hypothetical protein ACOYD3_06245 [Kiritimatiellia bacterium]|jgi:hypothetical protein
MTEPRIASFRTLADLLTVQLAQTPGVETVERAELDRVLREQALTAAGLADGAQGRVAVGRLLRADGFLFLARTASLRQYASRLVEARHGCQVMQMLYATNEAPAVIAERIAGAVSAKLPTLRLADEQRILLNVIRLGNATLDPRAGWIETDGVTMLSGCLAAHPAVLVVERREMGTLLQESQLADAAAPAFRAADFLIDGDVFLTPGSTKAQDDLPVTLVLLAAERGQLQCVELLLVAGANPRHRDNQSRTALQVSPDPGILRALMEAGANPLEPSISGHYPMDFCTSGSEKYEMLWLGTMPGALEVNRRPLPVRPPSHLVHTARVDRALARLRQGETLSDAERNACLIAFASYYTEVSSRQKYMYARRFTEPERIELYLQAVKMGFIDWRRHGGWAFRSDLRAAVCPGIEQRLADGPFDPYLAFCILFSKIQRCETEAARRDFERIRESDPFLARHVIQWSYRHNKQVDWLIEPCLAGGDRDRVRQLAQLVRQQETPEMLRIAADLHRRGGDTAEADALLARAEKMEAK